tara:strand:+ start:678 stop:1325 length:648 start_codon:yes stop_codon:yes gene_type:complete
MKNEFEKRLLTSFFIIPLCLFFIIKGSLFYIFFLGIIFLISIYEWFELTKNLKVSKIIGMIFILFSIYSAYLLRNEKGVYVFIFILLISVLTDIGGYLFGKTFKGPKLTKISPNKTYSGVIGSFFLSIIGGLTYFNLFMGNIPLRVEQHIVVLTIIVIISLVSQLGDLIVSFFKRINKIKNTGKILPGHGGLLDRIDGIIFTMPFSYTILNYLNF